MNIELKAPSNLESSEYEILLKDMNATDWDQMRILLSSIFKYGQFKNAETNAEQLSLSAAMDTVTKVRQ
jgi:hypothetical protein